MTRKIHSGRLKAIEDLAALITEPLLVLDSRLGVLNMNEPAQAILGVPLKEAAGRPCGEALAGQGYGQTIAKICRAALSKGAETSHKVSATTPGRRALRWRIRAVPVDITAEGEQVVVVSLSLDGRRVSGLVEGTSRGRPGASDADQFRVLLDLLPDMVFEVDSRGRVLYANGMTVEVSGYEPELIRGLHITQLVKPADGTEITETIESMLEGQAIHRNRRYFFTRWDGRAVPVEINAIVIQGPDGKPRVLGIARDFTERFLLEQRLRHSEERYRDLFDSSRDFIFTTDLQGSIQEINRTGVEFIGQPRDELVGRPFVGLLADEQGEWFQKALEEAFQRRTGYVEFELAGRDGQTHVFEVALAPVLQEKQVVEIHGTARDVTEQRKMQGQLLQLQKMDSLGRLAAGVAHDFNNVLGAVLGFASVMDLNIEEKNPLKHDLVKIVQAAQQGAGLTRQILSFARGGARKDELVDLAEMAREVTAVLEPGLPKNLSVELRTDETLRPVKGDPSQLRQVFMNLCTNARDVMPNGGTMTVTLRNGTDWPGGLDRQTPEAPPVEIAVADQGPGIPASVQQRIFEPFFTTKPAGQGIGLGLSICWGIVRDHGGLIDVESEPGKGAAFRVLLPSALNAPVRRPAASPHRAYAATGRALVVDDQEHMRIAAQRMLETAGYAVTCAAGWNEARDAFESAPKGFDVAIVDLSMPDVDGITVCRRLKEKYPRLPVIAVSGYSAEGASQKVLRQGARAFLQKPFSYSELVETIERVRKGK